MTTLLALLELVMIWVGMFGLLIGGGLIVFRLIGVLLGAPV